MASLDLDAKRAARADAEQEPHKVTLGGEVFQLRPRLPLLALDLMAEGQFRAAFRLVLLDDLDAEVAPLTRFFAQIPDDGDLEAIMEGLYGQTLGESAASPASSASGGRRSKPISPRTTT